MRTAVALSLCLSLSGLARAQEAAPAPAQVPPAATAPTPAPTAEPEETIPNPPKVWAYAFGGAALGLWVIAAATGGAALGLASAQNGDPTNPMPYTQSLANDADTGKTLAATAYAFIGLAAVATIVDAVLWYECFKKPRKLEKGGAPAKSASRVQFTGTGVRF
jgi:hypothetical protein